MPDVVAIIQARMTSTRLPGKVLMDLAGRPMLEQQLRRLALAATVDEIVIATTDNVSDDPVCALAERLGVGCFRGSEHDVLDRFVRAARQAEADIVVRVTADCPLLDPALVDAVVAPMLEDPECDYASNVLQRCYPRGLDVEALRTSVLERVAASATSKEAREHVTWHIVREAPGAFRTHAVTEADDHSDLRWTVDTDDDLALVRRLYADLDLGAHPRGYRDVLAHVQATPELRTINRHVQQKAA